MEKFEKNTGYAFYKAINEPKHIAAPMVDQSELAFRMLTRKYGAQLCYTPMLHAKMMVIDKSYKKFNFTTCAQDRPLIVQFCGNDPQILLQAAKMVEDECDAVDINLGCPQGIARKGHYGAFLLNELELIKSIVETLSQNLKIPVTCKVRLLPTEEATFKLVKTIQDAGCSMLTVHGRTKEQNKVTVGSCNWEMIKKIKNFLNIPVIANGGIYKYQDVLECLKQTGVEGVMSSESLLENPALFSNQVHDLDDLALEYLDLCKLYETDSSYIKAHLFKMLYTGLQQSVDLRDKLVTEVTLDGFYQIANELKQRRLHLNRIDKFGWYERYQKKKEIKSEKEKSKPEVDATELDDTGMNNLFI